MALNCYYCRWYREICSVAVSCGCSLVDHIQQFDAIKAYIISGFKDYSGLTPKPVVKLALWWIFRSIDAKAWSQLQSLFAPEISVDYKSVGGPQVSSILSKFIIQGLSTPAQLDNPGVTTQHFIGACRWSELSKTRVQVKFQIRAAHWNVSDENNGTERAYANGYGLDTMEFGLREEGWKIVLIAVEARWIEDDFKNIFKSKIQQRFFLW